MRVALVRCAVLPEKDPDMEPLLAALRRRGVVAGVIEWDPAPHAAPAHNPADWDVCVIRATWNYWRFEPQFRAWLDRAAGATKLLNPAPAVRWNMHKRYLLELRSLGVPVVPTLIGEHRGHASTPALAEADGLALLSQAAAQGWGEVVVKPCVSGGSWLTRVFAAGEHAAAAAFAAELLRERDAMVQPFIPSVRRGGERSIVVVAGEVTHAIVKHPRFAGDAERIEPAPVTPRERDEARRVLDACRRCGVDDLLFARVDVMAADTGGDLLSELEIIEPSLFFQHGPEAADRLADEIIRRGA